MRVLGYVHSQAGLYTYIIIVECVLWRMVCAFCHQMGKGGALGAVQ